MNKLMRSENTRKVASLLAILIAFSLIVLGCGNKEREDVKDIAELNEEVEEEVEEDLTEGNDDLSEGGANNTSNKSDNQVIEEDTNKNEENHEENMDNEDSQEYYETGEPMEDYGYGDDDYWDDLMQQESEEAEPLTPLEEIYGEEEFKQAVRAAEEFIETYNNVDGDNPNHPDEILEKLEDMMFEISWNRLPLVVKTLITHSDYKTKLVDYERRDTQFSPADASVPMQLVFAVVLEVEDFDGNKREVQENQIVYLRQLYSGDYQVSGFAINKIFK